MYIGNTNKNQLSSKETVLKRENNQYQLWLNYTISSGTSQFRPRASYTLPKNKFGEGSDTPPPPNILVVRSGSGHSFSVEKDNRKWLEWWWQWRNYDKRVIGNGNGSTSRSVCEIKSDKYRKMCQRRKHKLQQKYKWRKQLRCKLFIGFKIVLIRINNRNLISLTRSAVEMKTW